MRSQKGVFGILQCAGNSPCPTGLGRRIADQILTDLDLHVGQPARLTVARNRVVGFIADKVRFVIAHEQPLLPAQHIQHETGEAAIAVVEDRRVHFAPDVLVAVRHAVLRHQNRGTACRESRIQQRAHTGMVGIEDRGSPRADLRCAQSQVARNAGPLTQRRNRAGNVRIAVAVDHEPRIVLGDERSIKRRRNFMGYAEAADVPGNVPFQLGRRHAEVTQLSRNAPARVVNHDDEVRRPLRAPLAEGRRLIRREQWIHGINRLRHSGDRSRVRPDSRGSRSPLA